MLKGCFIWVILGIVVGLVLGGRVAANRLDRGRSDVWAATMKRNKYKAKLEDHKRYCLGEDQAKRKKDEGK